MGWRALKNTIIVFSRKQDVLVSKTHAKFENEFEKNLTEGSMCKWGGEFAKLWELVATS